MWTQINIDDLPALENYVNIMRQMDSHYSALQVSDVRTVLYENKGEAWHYQGSDVEIVMLFQYSVQRIQWQITHCGFLGMMQPSAVLDLVIDRVHQFMVSHATQYVYAFRPNTVEYVRLQQLHDLVSVNPRLRVTVVGSTDEGVVWQIEYVGA